MAKRQSLIDLALKITTPHVYFVMLLQQRQAVLPLKQLKCKGWSLPWAAREGEFALCHWMLTGEMQAPTPAGQEWRQCSLVKGKHWNSSVLISLVWLTHLHISHCDSFARFSACVSRTAVWSQTACQACLEDPSPACCHLICNSHCICLCGGMWCSEGNYAFLAAANVKVKGLAFCLLLEN